MSNLQQFNTDAKIQAKGDKIMPTDKPRLMVVVDDEMLKKIDDLRFERRYASRSQLMNELLKLGIEEMEKAQDKTTKEG